MRTASLKVEEFNMGERRLITNEEMFVVPRADENSFLPGGDLPPLDTRELLHRCLGKIEFAEQILKMFQERFVDSLLELEQHVELRDADGVRHVSHRLKGATASVAAKRLARIAAAIEQLGAQKDLRDISNHMQALREEWARFLDYTVSLPPAPDQAMSHPSHRTE